MINFKEIQSVGGNTLAVVLSTIKCRQKDASDAGHTSIEFYSLEVWSEYFKILLTKAIDMICPVSCRLYSKILCCFCRKKLIKSGKALNSEHGEEANQCLGMEHLPKLIIDFHPISKHQME